MNGGVNSSQDISSTKARNPARVAKSACCSPRTNCATDSWQRYRPRADEGEAFREILTHLVTCRSAARRPGHRPAAAGIRQQCGDDLLIRPLPEYEFDQRIAW